MLGENGTSERAVLFVCLSTRRLNLTATRMESSVVELLVRITLSKLILQSHMCLHNVARLRNIVQADFAKA